MTNARPASPRRALFLALAWLLFLFTAPLPAAQTRPGADAAAKAPPIRAGQKAPDFSLQSAQGSHYRLSDRIGEKNLVLIFFRGPW